MALDHYPAIVDLTGSSVKFVSNGKSRLKIVVMGKRVKKQVATHERLVREEEIRGSSNRVFGLVFAAVFTMIGLWPLVQVAGVRLWALAVAVVFLATAVIRPAFLTPLNRLWTRFGLLLHAVVNPVVMGLLFYLMITPTAYVMRWLGKDHLNLRWDPAAKSYWIERRPPGPAPESMKNQF